MVKKLLLGVVALVGAYLLFVALSPSGYEVYREASITAAPEKIFPYLHNSKNMNLWNPLSELDPTAKVSYSGPESGLNAKTEWTDGNWMGTGSATVVEANPFTTVVVKLEYVKPEPFVQFVAMNLKDESGKTIARWSVKGDTPFMGKLLRKQNQMEADIGIVLEKGLARLKALAEASK